MNVQTDERVAAKTPSIREFSCCDTTFHVRAEGHRAQLATRLAYHKARALESQLDAFDDDSAISQLNRVGIVTNKHVAAVVRRGLEYRELTEGVFDIFQGDLEMNLKVYLDFQTDTLSKKFSAGTVGYEGSTVYSDIRLDLNGLAKGYIVDRTSEALRDSKRTGFVSGGGDMSPPTGPVAIDHPESGDDFLEILDTDWSVATSGGYRRHREDKDHIYDPTSHQIGARQQSVTVLARRDCMEADALATTLAAMPLDEGMDLAEKWSGLEALIYNGGDVLTTEGFDRHVQDS